jgi:hypothetical protein
MGLGRYSTGMPPHSRKRQRAHERIEYFARSLLILGGDDQADTAITEAFPVLSLEINDPV